MDEPTIHQRLNEISDALTGLAKLLQAIAIELTVEYEVEHGGDS